MNIFYWCLCEIFFLCVGLFIFANFRHIFSAIRIILKCCSWNASFVLEEIDYYYFVFPLWTDFHLHTWQNTKTLQPTSLVKAPTAWSKIALEILHAQTLPTMGWHMFCQGIRFLQMPISPLQIILKIVTIVNPRFISAEINNQDTCIQVINTPSEETKHIHDTQQN